MFLFSKLNLLRIIFVSQAAVPSNPTSKKPCRSLLKGPKTSESSGLKQSGGIIIAEKQTPKG